jgi:hypothetical protein
MVAQETVAQNATMETLFSETREFHVGRRNCRECGLFSITNINYEKVCRKTPPSANDLPTKLRVQGTWHR